MGLAIRKMSQNGGGRETTTKHVVFFPINQNFIQYRIVNKHSVVTLNFKIIPCPLRVTGFREVSHQIILSPVESKPT